jgi:hypothetical protein
MKGILLKLLRITIPAVMISGLVTAALVEVGVRVTWDAKKGTPGFFVSSETRIEKLAPDYTGWFAGVPVRINTLGFRDTREYELAKQPNTFRIVVLGDSVTFGHGALYETTYPFLLEDKLKKWRPEIDWQVWNLGVPGYNTSQELAYWKEINGVFKPDLVIVGFYWNDVFDNFPPRSIRYTNDEWSRK